MFPQSGGKGTQLHTQWRNVAFGSPDHTTYFTKISGNLTDGKFRWRVRGKAGAQSVWGRSVTVVDEGIFYIPDFRPIIVVCRYDSISLNKQRRGNHTIRQRPFRSPGAV
jgi:hypothetical protein